MAVVRMTPAQVEQCSPEVRDRIRALRETSPEPDEAPIYKREPVPRRARRRADLPERVAASLEAAALPWPLWALLAAGGAALCLTSVLLGGALGVVVAGYLAAPDRAVEVAALAVAGIGGWRAVRRRADRWNALADATMAAAALALAVGLRP